jgi:hypothetical protein
MTEKEFQYYNNGVIVAGICMQDGEDTPYCGLHYACDACPYNLDRELEERLQTGL